MAGRPLQGQYRTCTGTASPSGRVREGVRPSGRRIARTSYRVPGRGPAGSTCHPFASQRRRPACRWPLARCIASIIAGQILSTSLQFSNDMMITREGSRPQGRSQASRSQPRALLAGSAGETSRTSDDQPRRPAPRAGRAVCTSGCGTWRVAGGARRRFVAAPPWPVKSVGSADRIPGAGWGVSAIASRPRGGPTDTGSCASMASRA